MKYIYLLCGALILSGCAATGQSFSGLTPSTKEKEQIVVYRPSSLIGFAESPMLSINGADKCSMPVGSFVTESVRPGKTEISSSLYGGSVKSTISFDGVAGQTYFIKLSANAGNAVAGGFGAAGALAHGVTTDDHGVYSLRIIDDKAGAQEAMKTNEAISCK